MDYNCLKIKFAVVAMVCCCFSDLKAQAEAENYWGDIKYEFPSKWQFEIAAGASAAGDFKHDAFSVFRPHGGVRVAYNFREKESGGYVNLGVFLSGEGFERPSFALSSEEQLHDVRCDAYYLKPSIHLGYKFHVGEITSMFIEAGPFLDYGLFGSAKSNYHYTEERKTHDLYGDSGLLKRWYFGVGARTGFEFNSHFSLSAGFDVGISDFTNEYRGYVEREYSTNTYVSLGYIF
ncbi:MAG: outer membrane beta-barrel protein [Muribaculaceae bacterium]|nr:outer membrane beta-barrel protein [Muribaculaceae bacterium]